VLLIIFYFIFVCGHSRTPRFVVDAFYLAGSKDRVTESNEAHTSSTSYRWHTARRLRCLEIEINDFSLARLKDGEGCSFFSIRHFSRFFVFPPLFPPHSRFTFSFQQSPFSHN
jgi:hypothetical protein